MAIKKFKIEASEQAKQLAKKPVKASDGEWDKAVISFIDTIPELPEQGKVISKKYKGFPVVIVGLGDGKCLYNGYTRTNDAASDVQFIRGLIKRGDSPEKATANLGFKTYTRGDVEEACGDKKKSIKSAETGKSIVNDIKNYITDFYDVNYGIPVDFSDMANIPISFAYEGKTDKLLAQVVIDTVNAEIAYVENGKRKTLKQFADLDDLWDFMQKHSFDDYEAMLVGTSDIKAAAGKKRWGLYSDFGQRILNETFDSKREAQKAFREYGYTKDSEAWIEEVDETAVGKFDKKPANSACGGKKTVKSSARRPARRSVKAADSTIKRYSDVVPKEDRKYWYFTTHGLGPGMIPKGINVLKVQEGQNRNGTWGDFILLDAILNTDELKQYDLIELAPKDVNASTKRKPMKQTVKASKRSRSVKASEGDASELDEVYKVLSEMQGTWKNPETGWTGKCELYQRDLEDGSYVFSLVFGNNISEPDDILYVPSKHKFTIYPNSGMPRFANSLDEFKRNLKAEYSYLTKINAATTVKASAAAKRRAKQRVTASMPDLEDIVMYFDRKKIYEGDGSGLTAAVEELCKDDEIKAKFVEWCNQFGDPVAFESGDAHDTAFAFAWLVDTIRYEELDKFYIDGDGILNFEVFNKSDEVTGAKKSVTCSEDGPLCVCDSCLAGIESHEGRQVIYDEIYSDADYGEPPLICDWCGDEVEKLYQITPGERIESAEQPVKASKYYEITDHNNNEVGRSDLEDEARELAKKLLRENDEDHYDIWWVDTDPDSTDDTSYIDTVYADKPFSVEGYYEANFRGLSDSDTFYELRDALEYAQELLSKGLSVRMECENAGGRLEITPDEYDEFVQTADGAMFEDMPEVAEWISAVQVERMDSNQEPWLDNWQYNTDIGMSVTATNSLDMTAGTDIPKGWNLYGYDLNGEDVDSSYVTFQGDVEKEVRKLFENPEIDTIDLYEVVDEHGTSDYFDTFTRDDIDASTGVKAALGNKNKTDYASNPIYELDKYVKDLAEGVAAAAGITLTYQVSDEAITFIDGDGTAVFIQPISEITPEPDDLEDDIQQLVSAIQYEDMDNPEYWPTDTSEDDPDYATRAVQMSVDDELEPVMGEGEDIGFGVDSYGETIDESTVSELYRIAEKEILPNTELAQIDPYVSIDEDSWDFYFGGISNAGMMGVVKFYIHFKLTSDNIDLNEYVLPDAKLYPDFNYYKASLDFDIYTENGKVTDVVLESADIYKSDNSYDDHFSGKFGEAFNTEALENYIEKLAAPAAEEIYNAVSNL